MAVKANDLLKTMGESIGLSAEEITKLTSNATLSTIEIEDAIADKIKSTKVFTEESAKANPQLRSAIHAEIYNGVDAHIKTVAGKYELPDEVLTEIFTNEKKTSAKLEKTIEKISDLIKQKAGASGAAKTELEKQIEKLHAEVRAEKEGRAADTAKHLKAQEEALTNFAEENLYKGLEFAVPDGFDKDVISLGARQRIKAELEKRGVIMKMHENVLSPFTKDGTKYFENNTAMTADALVKKIALDNKLLKVNGAQSQHQQQQRQPNFNQPATLIQNGSQTVTFKDGGLDAKIAEGMKRDGFA